MMATKKKARNINSICSRLMAASALLATVSTGYAADLETGNQTADEATIDSVVYWGVDINKNHSQGDGFGIAAGGVTALNGDLSVSGWTVSGNVGYSKSRSTGSKTDSLYGSMLVGYLWVAPEYYFTLATGVHMVDNEESPGGGITDGHDVGAIFQYGFETTTENSFYVQSYGAVSTAYDQLYGHVKLGYKTSNLRYGGEFTISDDKGSKGTRRYGAFVGDIPITDSVSMVISGGYQDELGPDDSDGMYGTVGFSVPISTR